MRFVSFVVVVVLPNDLFHSLPFDLRNVRWNHSLFSHKVVTVVEFWVGSVLFSNIFSFKVKFDCIWLSTALGLHSVLVLILIHKFSKSLEFLEKKFQKSTTIFSFMYLFWCFENYEISITKKINGNWLNAYFNHCRGLNIQSLPLKRPQYAMTDREWFYFFWSISGQKKVKWQIVMFRTTRLTRSQKI